MLPDSDPIIDSIKNHWNSLRAGRVAPFRAEIDPNAFVAALGHMFILERLNPGDIRIRLAGMKICDLMGMEVRGMPLTAFMSDKYRAQLDEIIGVVLDHPSTAELSLRAIDAEGNQSTAALLLLPLRSDFGNISRIIGCMSIAGRDFNLPVRMSIEEQNISPIEYVGPVRQEHPLPGFYESAERFTSGSGQGLRKVVDNRAVHRSIAQDRPSQLRLVHSATEIQDK